jgi:hypothetical protein
MLLTDVQSDSLAHDLGLEPCDVIETVHGWPVTSTQTWNWLMSADLGYVRLGVRDGRTQRMVVCYARLARVAVAEAPPLVSCN